MKLFTAVTMMFFPFGLDVAEKVLELLLALLILCVIPVSDKK